MEEVAVAKTKNPATDEGAGSGSCYWVCVLYTYPNPAPVRTVIRRVTRVMSPLACAAPRPPTGAVVGAGARAMYPGSMLRCVMGRHKHAAEGAVNYFMGVIAETPNTYGWRHFPYLCPDSFPRDECAVCEGLCGHGQRSDCGRDSEKKRRIGVAGADIDTKVQAVTPDPRCVAAVRSPANRGISFWRLLKVCRIKRCTLPAMLTPDFCYIVHCRPSRILALIYDAV